MRWMLWRDVRLAARLLVKDRWFTVAAGFALALGIGANAAVFTFVNAVLLRGLPFDSPEQIIALDLQDTRGRQFGVPFPEFGDWREQSRTLAGLAAYVGSTINVSDGGQPPEQFRGTYLSANFFALIGERPLVGRGFSESDDRPGADPVAILSDGLWKRRYGGDAAVLGRTLKANSKVVTVIGVMPPGFQFPGNDDLWIPLNQLPPETLDPRRDVRNLNVLGRLAPGASLQQARAEFDAIGARLAETYPATNKDVRPRLIRFDEQVNGGPIRLVFLSLMGAVGFVLLIACANVANLLLARSSRRAREMAIRIALGASRRRIVQQLLVESVLLALLSAVVGLVIASAGVRWFDRATQDVGKPYWMTFDMDPAVFAFMAAICLGTALMFGLAPALQAARTDPGEVMKESGRSGTSGRRARRWTGALIVTELVLTLVLLAGAGFMMKSFLTLYRMDAGIDTVNMLTLQMYLPLTKYPQPAPRAAIYEQLEERIAELPSIEASTIASHLPLLGGMTRTLSIEGRPAPAGVPSPSVTMLTVGDRYFDTLRLPILRGRALTHADGPAGHEAVVINQRFAAMHFGTDDPIGRRIKLGASGPAAATLPEPAWATIVGVVPDVRQRSVQELQADPIAYISFRTFADRGAVVIARTTAPAAVTASLRETLRLIEPDLPLFNVRTLEGALQRSRWQFEVFGSMFAAFAFIALVLSGVGLYAVTAYSVTQRKQEIGIRMALGAQPRRMLWLVLGRTLAQLGVGLPLGLAGAYGVGRVLQSLLVQTGPADPVTLASIVVILVIVSVAAGLGPARHAARLNPLDALRN